MDAHESPTPFNVSRVDQKDVRVGSGQWRLMRRIGSGSFGDIFLAVDQKTKENVAVKIESSKTQHPQLYFEYKVYKLLANRGDKPHPRSSQPFAVDMFLTLISREHSWNSVCALLWT